MRQPEPYRDPEAFLSALADDLVAGPDEPTATRHVTTAAMAARSAHTARRARAVRLAVMAAILGTVLGTGGVALAGGLPAPIQDVVADVARALPVPIPVPYPEGAVGVASDGAEPALAPPPEEGEAEGDIDSATAETAEPHTSSAEPSSSQPILAARDDQREEWPECGEHEQAGEGPAAGCELDSDERTRSWRDLVADRIDRRSETDDEGRAGNREGGARLGDGGGEGRPHWDDRDDEEHRDHKEMDHDEEEELREDEQDDDRSSDDERRDGHD
ncbi:MAG: hypothetical protein ACRDWS_10905 [Acidimicrobiia bacterium]